MKYAHYIEMRVFSREDDDEELIREKIKELFPFKKKKIEYKEETAYGFEEKKIKIFAVAVKKQRRTTKVLKHLMSNLSNEQKEMLLSQMNSRLDEDLHFFFRLDKDKLLDGDYWITESGRCFRFKITVAAYPHDRAVAEEVVKKILDLGKT